MVRLPVGAASERAAHGRRSGRCETAADKLYPRLLQLVGSSTVSTEQPDQDHERTYDGFHVVLVMFAVFVTMLLLSLWLSTSAMR